MDLNLTNNFVDHVVGGIQYLGPRLLTAAFDLVVGIVVIRLVHRLVRLILKATQVQPGLRYVLTSLMDILLWIILVMYLLGQLGLSQAILLVPGALAVLGIALAAGGSTLVSDIAAGLYLAGDHDFNVGDEIAVMNDRPIVGVIERMDARRTRLRDHEGRLHVIPNSIVERKEWVVVRKRHEVTPLGKATKAARRLTAAALERKANAARKKRDNSENAQ
jgi:small-conductance mechanosensitive channel